MTQRDPLDLVPEAVLVLDTDHVVRRVNDRVRPLLGAADVVGAPIAAALTLLDDGGEVCADPVPARGTADRIAERLWRVVLPDGRERHVAMSGRFVDDGVVLTFRAAGRRVALDAARSDLVATVSHEIRSPLTSVKGFTRAMLARWDRYSDEQKRTFLETINEDADRVTRLLAELLDVSRIDANRVQLSMTGLDTAALARDVAEKARQRPDGDGRDIVVDATPDVPSLVIADRDKVEQILTNLVNNALRYAPDSQVRLVVRPWAGDGVLVAVADDGPGVPVEQQRAIFRKFGRGRESRRAGTGLGLFITRGLARAHGGDVELDSTPGEGATFTLTLPTGTIPGL